MESNTFNNVLIYRKFKHEWNRRNGNDTWKFLIDSKDLGVKFLGHDDCGFRVYKVTDQKKWLLNKIKYGF